MSRNPEDARLDCRLCGAHISDELAKELANRIWKVKYSGLQGPDFQLDSFILALERKLEVFPENRHIIRTFRQLLELVDVVKRNITEHRAELGRMALLTSREWFAQSDKNRLSTTLTDAAYNSIDFAVEILLLHRFNTAGESPLPGEHKFRWDKEDSTIAEAWRSILPRPQPQEHVDRKVFEDTFTLRDFQEFGDFVIQPTDNILQHLSVQKYKNRPNQLTLFIFFHVTAIERLQDWNNDLEPPFLDPNFLNETLQTLSLLLPFDDLDSIYWFNNYCKKFQRNLPRRFGSLSGIDPRAGQLPIASSQAVDYVYWLPRLRELEEEYRRYSPRTLKQFWRDRRRYHDWTLYWVGVGALVLALISSMTGMVSAVAGSLALRDDEYDRESVTTTCCCRDEVAPTNVVTTSSTAPASTPAVTLGPAQVIDPTQTLVVTVRMTTTVTIAGA